MKKFTKALIVALIGMSTVGCETFPSSSTGGNSSTTQTDPLLAAIESRIVLAKDKQEVSDDFEVPSLVVLTYEGKEIPLNLYTAIVRLEGNHLRYKELFEQLHMTIMESK